MESPIQLNDSDEEWLVELGPMLPKQTAVDAVGGIFCNLCHSTFANKKVFDRHYTEQHNRTTPAIMYTCVLCRKEIAPYPNFRNHCYLVHVAKNRFKCEQCNKHFSKQSVLTKHMNSMHTFACASCQNQFATKGELNIHQNIHKREKERPPYPCNQCSETIETVDICEMHVEEHLKVLYPCPICDETTNSKMEITKHLTTHFDEVYTDEDTVTKEISEDCSIDLLGGVLCCYCDELFKNRPDTDLHFINEHSDKDIVYSCNICGKQYANYQLFANHCYYHVAKNRFECVECGKLFPRLSLLVLHTEAFHTRGSRDVKPFSCGQCGHAFGTACRLREHLRVVHTRNDFMCPEDGCDMTFETPRDLILHQRKHKGSHTNCCRKCGLQFTTLSSCQAHLNVHRIKNYACPVCNKQYREKHLITKHIPIHFESVLHVCKVCGKVFNARSRLVEHMKTHSEVRRHQCSFCSKAFMRPHQLEQHLNIHTGLKPYKCIICSKTFASYPNWVKHMQKVHNVDKNTVKTLVENRNEAIKNENTVKNTMNFDRIDSEVRSESGIESTSPEMSLDTYIFGESDDSTMDSIDPAILEKDWNIFNENSLVDNSLKYTDLMPVTNTTLETEIKPTPIEQTVVSQSAVHVEYGPEFNVDDGIHLDDHYLPHIDPLLTIKPDIPQPVHKFYVNNYEYNTPAAAADPQTPWEPFITKVYHTFESDDVNRLPLMNTNIY